MPIHADPINHPLAPEPRGGRKRLPRGGGSGAAKLEIWQDCSREAALRNMPPRQTTLIAEFGESKTESVRPSVYE